MALLQVLVNGKRLAVPVTFIVQAFLFILELPLGILVTFGFHHQVHIPIFVDIFRIILFDLAPKLNHLPTAFP